jgi:TPR repeat protein
MRLLILVFLITLTTSILYADIIYSDSLMQVALKGNTQAQYNIGLCYENGLGVIPNQAEAVKWYRLAANKGKDYAQNTLGECYYKGMGVKQDYKQAIKWFRLASDLGNAKAQYNLGICYFKGQGVIQDNKHAYKLFLLACANGTSDDFKRFEEARDVTMRRLKPVEVTQIQQEAKAIQAAMEAKRK